MKVIKNCALAVRLAVHYAPWSALLYFLTCFIPGFFNGCKVILMQRLVDSGVAYAGMRLGTAGMQSVEGMPSMEGVYFIEGAHSMEGMQSVSGAYIAQDMAVTGTVLVVMLFVWFVLERLQGYEEKVLESRLTRYMAPDIMDKLGKLEYCDFESREVQEVLQRISGEPWQNVKSCFVGSMCSIYALLSLGFMLSVYASVSFWIGAGIFLVAIPMLVMNFAGTKRLQGIWRSTTMQARRIADLKLLMQDKHAMYEMKIFGSQEMIAGKWEEASSGVEREIRKTGRSVMALEGGSRLLSLVCFVFIIIALTFLFLQGRVTTGQFVAVIGSLSTITGQVYTATWTVTNTFRSALDMEFYQEFLALRERTDKRNVETLSHGDIAFENVSFTYPGTDREILKNVTFRIRAGERVAFVGENGAGKSTLVKLLCGLYEPDAGRVLIGGVNVRDLSEELRRRMLSVVFQDFQEYELTLRENVALGDISALKEDDRIRQALEQAGGAGLYLQEEKGLERNLGHLEEDGKDLSRGQWQRVAIARAFLADAAFCVLDEPTAALDPLAESRMYENFLRIFHKNGTVMISHRLASAKMADRIMVLDGGRIVQNGSHEQLVGTEGLYRTMYLAQSSWYADSGEKDVREDSESREKGAGVESAGGEKGIRMESASVEKGARVESAGVEKGVRTESASGREAGVESASVGKEAGVKSASREKVAGMESADGRKGVSGELGQGKGGYVP